MSLNRDNLRRRAAGREIPAAESASIAETPSAWRSESGAGSLNGKRYASLPFAPVNPGLAERPRHIQSLFEFWPPALFYAPVIAYWFWLGFKHRSLTLPTVANPLMEMGGLCGESKTREFATMAGRAREWLAPYVSAIRAPGADLAQTAQTLLREAEDEGFGFPLVAKPDIGCQGAGVRVMRSQADLIAYLEAFPVGERLLLQRLI